MPTSSQPTPIAGTPGTLLPGLTVVVPFRGRRDMLEPLLASLRGQGVDGLRVVVVDNDADASSTAFFGEAARRWSDPTMSVSVVSESGPGACRARNAGLAAVTTEWTMFFDSDDEMLPGHIAAALGCSRLHPEAEVIGWDVNFVHAGASWRQPFETRRIAFHNVFHSAMATQRYMARTRLFRRAGGWNEQVPIWNDIELGVRLLALRPAVAKVEGRPRVNVRLHADSITGASYTSRTGAFDTALQCMRGVLEPEKRHWIDFKQAILAGCFSREGALAESGRLYAEAAARVKPSLRPLLWIAYRYTALGLRGIARILAPVIS